MNKNIKTIIGFIGYRGSGKTTAADYLVENYGFIKHNFKDGLVKEMKSNFPQLLESFRTSYNLPSVDDLFVEKPALMRILMQEYGTEVRRRDNSNYWVNKWNAGLKWPSGPENYVVDDIRFQNEYDRVVMLGNHSKCKVVIIRLHRTDIKHEDNHISETEQADLIADYNIITELGEQDKLFTKLSKLVNYI